MPGRVWSVSSLGLLTLAVGYAVFRYGGGRASDCEISLLIVGSAGIICGFRSSRADPISPLERLALWAALLFPAYVALQLIPLPLFLLRIVSPARAELTGALEGVMPAVRYAPLTISPPKTWFHLPRIAGYALILLVVRGVARGPRKRLWALVVPLIAIGALEAGWGLVRYATGDSVVAVGTYIVRDHFAGLLEMILPFAITYAVALSCRGRDAVVFSASLTIRACVAFSVAAVLFFGIIFSFSRMGYISLFGSLLVMGVLAVCALLPGWKKWPALAGVALFVFVAFLYLAPGGLLVRFEELGPDPSGSGRLPLWKDTLRLLAAYPLFGCGLFNFFPGLLRYQTSRLFQIWFEAHNDYLQLLAELGVIGFLIPAALMIAVFGCAVRAAVSATVREARFLGIACAGGLSAILIHSAGDFNLYIPANAMVFWWIAGLSAGLPVSSGRHRQAPSVEGPSFVRRFAVALGCLLTLYTSAWLVFFYGFRNDRAAERAFCRFGICDPNNMLATETGWHWLWGAVLYGRTAARTPAELGALVRRDPAGPYGWCELGEAFQREGKPEAARYCYRRAVTLSPDFPATLWAAADFHFSLGENQDALALMARLMEAAPDAPSAVFGAYDQRRVTVDEILRYGLRDRDSSQAYLHRLLAAGNVPAAIETWNWIASRGYADDRLAAGFINFLLQKKRYETAAECWTRYLGPRRRGYPEKNRLFNGDFEFAPTGCAFDWNIGTTGAAQIMLDHNLACSGNSSLRIHFNGTENISFSHVTQTAFIEPGRYRFRACIRTEGITTDQGVGFQVFDAESGARLNFSTETLTGDNDWRRLEKRFAVAAPTRLIEVRVVRQPSLKFDNKIAGTVWVDAVSIERETP